MKRNVKIKNNIKTSVKIDENTMNEGKSVTKYKNLPTNHISMFRTPGPKVGEGVEKIGGMKVDCSETLSPSTSRRKLGTGKKSQVLERFGYLENPGN